MRKKCVECPHGDKSVIRLNTLYESVGLPHPCHMNLKLICIGSCEDMGLVPEEQVVIHPDKIEGYVARNIDNEVWERNL